MLPNALIGAPSGALLHGCLNNGMVYLVDKLTDSMADHLTNRFSAESTPVLGRTTLAVSCFVKLIYLKCFKAQFYVRQIQKFSFKNFKLFENKTFQNFPL